MTSCLRHLVCTPLRVLTCGCCCGIFSAEDVNVVMRNANGVASTASTTTTTAANGGEKQQQQSNKLADKETIIAQIKSKEKLLQQFPHHYRYDKDIVMAAVTTDGLELEHLLDQMKSNKEIAMAAVSQNGLALEYVPTSMATSNKDVVLAAVSQNGDAIRFAPNHLKEDKEVVIAALKNDTFFTLPYQFVGPTIRGHKEVAMMAVTQNGLQLRFVPPHLKLERDIILAAVGNKGRALMYAPPIFQIDQQVVLKAVQNDGSAIEFAADVLKEDTEVALTAIRQNGSSLTHIPDKLKSNINFALEVVQQDGSALQYFPPNIKANRDVVMTAVDQKWYALQFADDSLKGDKRVVLTAASHNLLAVRYATEDLRKHDKDVSRYVFELEWKKKNFSTNGIFDKQATLDAIAANPRSFQFAPAVFRADKEVVIAAVQRNPEMLKYALGGLNQDRDCWIAAGLWSVDQERKKNADHVVRIALSTKFSLEEKSSSSVTHFTKLLNDNPFIRDGYFAIYSPNAFSKDTCDPKWTRLDWPCRGTRGTCLKPTHLKTGKPKLECCWRYSFRWHLEEARRTNGFMIQVVDLDGQPGLYEESKSDYKLGDGQQIETEMAKDVGCKIFRIYRPRIITATNAQILQDFRPEHIESLVYIIQEWYNSNCSDMNDHEITSEDNFKRISCQEADL